MNLICHVFVVAVHCCVVDISAGIIDRLILNPVCCSTVEACDLFVYLIMKHHTSPAPWSSPHREILNTMQVPGCHTAQLNDLCFCNSIAIEAPFPTPWASLDATKINEISHADGARASEASERFKNLCHGTGIHMGGT